MYVMDYKQGDLITYLVVDVFKAASTALAGETLCRDGMLQRKKTSHLPRLERLQDVAFLWLMGDQFKVVWGVVHIKVIPFCDEVSKNS